MMKSDAVSLPTFDSIAFCGGCAKGAYHIGVWKALDELGLTSSVRAVSGTSIGALNAALFALGDWNQARDVWFSVRESTAFSIGKSGDGVFSRDGLLKILNRLDLARLRKSPVQVFCNIHELGAAKPESVRLNPLPPQRQREILLASSAMPLIYETVEIQGKRYVDGGVTALGNTPVEVLYRHQGRNILILSLKENFDFTIRDGLLGETDLYALCQGANLHVIAPLESLNHTAFNGVLPDFDFSARAVKAKMIAGYQDAKKQLSEMESVYMMRNDYAKMNTYIRLKMQKMFSKGEEIQVFLDTTNFSWLNVPMRVAGIYADLVNIDGWRVQQDKLLKRHYRIVDSSGVCRAYTFNPNDLIAALDSYDATIKFMDLP